MFLTITARLVETDYGEEINLNNSGSRPSSLLKAKSVLDVKDSDPLIG
jgi:hypothetical protein